ncbi:MAG: sugar phosphate isomerase/epimerase [Acidobacteria bacterium]|nr:sugar phosphate isomerase/epimerase [Acidobacteriota bacterium]
MSRPRIGLELWTVRTDVNRDLLGALSRVAELGYESVEFYSTYLDWTLDFAREVRARLDAVGLACSSTHNGMRAFTPDAMRKTIDLNHVLGSPFAVVASVPKIETIEGWREATERFADVAERLRPSGLAAGFHNHQREWTLLDGQLPIDVVADGTPSDFVMQIDVAPAVEFGIDVPAWIRTHPGRVRSLHGRDWSATRGPNLAFGEGDCPWREIIVAAGATSDLRDVLVENGHSTPDEEWDIAARSIANWRAL